MTRTDTPDRVNDDGSRTITTKRACNGCGNLLGDITNSEMAAAIDGRPLPDVRRECPACGPTAPETVCVPVGVLAGDGLCLEMECDHDRKSEAEHCDQVREETICDTHSRTEMIGWHEQIVHAEPWPCRAVSGA
ncbi:hypothetical protein ACN24M_20300 [Streptomyces microflavus]|uniref:hypothetical protein n=1 Tax=Streptomyces microflavus TaxID=1919 RepID=UPI003B20BDE3